VPGLLYLVSNGPVRPGVGTFAYIFFVFNRRPFHQSSMALDEYVLHVMMSRAIHALYFLVKDGNG
jgi:hypothetical protein